MLQYALIFLGYICLCGFGMVLFTVLYRKKHWYQKQHALQIYLTAVTFIQLLVTWILLFLGNSGTRVLGLFGILCVLIGWQLYRVRRTHLRLRDVVEWNPGDTLVAQTPLLIKAYIAEYTEERFELRAVNSPKRFEVRRLFVPMNKNISTPQLQKGYKVNAVLWLKRTDPELFHQKASWAYIHYADLNELRILANYVTSYRAWTVAWGCFLLQPFIVIFAK